MKVDFLGKIMTKDNSCQLIFSLRGHYPQMTLLDCILFEILYFQGTIFIAPSYAQPDSEKPVSQFPYRPVWQLDIMNTIVLQLLT